MRNLLFLLWLASSAFGIDTCSNVKKLVFQINENGGFPRYISENIYQYKLECQNSVLFK